jgi:hypothetical protein
VAYTPKLWQDRIKDSQGNIIQEGTPFSAGNMNHIEQGIADAHAQLDVASRQVQTLGHGLSVLNGNNNAPVDIQIEGRTLVNLLGVDGNFEKDLSSDWLKGGTYSYDTSLANYGTRSLKMTTNNSTATLQKEVNSTEPTKYYIFIADFYVKSLSSGTIKIAAFDANSWNNPVITYINNTVALNKWIPKYVKFTTKAGVRIQLGADTSTAEFNIDGARLYEITAEEYANIGTVWNDDEVARRYPYVDSVQHVQNPYVLAEGDNLIPPFTDSAWTLHPNAIVTSPYNLTLNATAAWQASSIYIPVVPGQSYTLSLGSGTTGKVYVGTTDINKTNLRANLINGISGGQSGTITVQSNEYYLSIAFSNATTGTFTFTNPMLNIGSTAKPFVPRNTSYLFAEVRLGSLADKKDILFKDGQDWKVTKWIEKDVVLDGKLVWYLSSDYPGYKRVYADGTQYDPNFNNKNNWVITKNNGLKLKNTAFDGQETSSGDEGFISNDTPKNVYITIFDTDSGWSEHYKPSAQEIQAYFNGWKANGFTTGTAVTNELTGQLAPSGTYTFVQSGSYRNVVVEKSTDGTTWSPAVENTDFKIDISGTKAALTNLSLSPMYFRISYSYGVAVNSWASLVDGSAPATNTLAYVSANMAPGFTPYKLSYVLSSPQTIVVSDKVEGDIVVNGATQVEVGSGIVIREKIAPKQHSTTLDWYINEIGVSSSVQDSPLKYRVSKIMNIYRNGVIDSKWAQTTSSSNQNGTVYATIKNTDYDPTAEYSVTYMLLDRQSFTTNILSVTATYANNIRTALDDTIKRVEDNTTNISIQARLLYDILKRLKAGGL